VKRLDARMLHVINNNLGAKEKEYALLSKNKDGQIADRRVLVKDP